MIISKTPVRVSFFGGGTDYPDYFQEFDGAVLSTTIDKYIYITVNKISGLLDHKFRITYSKLELCHDVEEIQHPVVREVIKYLDIPFGLDINIISDLPARTGIGSSSSFTVGLLNALYSLMGITKSKESLAKDAIHIEYTVLKERVGVQDQLAAAYGGFNHMNFSKKGLMVNKVEFNMVRKMDLQSNLLLYYTGINRFASVVLEEQVNKMQQKSIITELKEIYDMVDEGMSILTDSYRPLDDFGLLMNHAWEIKRRLSSAISTPVIDQMYNLATDAGALGGKLLGAGGGGFFLFYVPKQKHVAVKQALMDYPLVDFKFENGGARIIHSY